MFMDGAGVYGVHRFDEVVMKKIRERRLEYFLKR